MPELRWACQPHSVRLEDEGLGESLEEIQQRAQAGKVVLSPLHPDRQGVDLKALALLELPPKDRDRPLIGGAGPSRTRVRFREALEVISSCGD